jgi:phytoene dehydrogenase-like protein
MMCPICHKRKPKRYCPAKQVRICAVCCGTEREVTIDCPSDCPHLIASRQYGEGRREIDWENVPFPDHEVSRAVSEAHADLYTELSFIISTFARDNPGLADPDVAASLRALAETYQTLTKGILYENPPEYRLQRELYDQLKAAVERYKTAEGPGLVAELNARDPEIRDALILFARFAAIRSNRRPKGRAFIDSLRSQFKPGTFAKKSSSLILTP